MASELIVRTESVELIGSLEPAVSTVPLGPPGSVVELLVPATAASAAVAVSTASAATFVPAPEAVGVFESRAPITHVARELVACEVSAEATPVVDATEATVPPTDEELDAIQLDAVKLHAYQVALELHSLCSAMVSALPNRIVRDQLERASLSVVLNCAEGGGRRSRRDKAVLYDRAWQRDGGGGADGRAGMPSSGAARGHPEQT
jgi:hypothetical protein